MKQEYKESFVEVNEIINMMPRELADKIPNRFKDMLEKEKDKEYKTSIHEPIEECKLKDETIIILGLIYRDFLCAPEERKRLQEKDAKELQETKDELERELREKYNPEDIFKKRKHNEDKIENDESFTETRLTVAEEKWYKKLYSIIKTFFKLRRKK